MNNRVLVHLIFALLIAGGAGIALTQPTAVDYVNLGVSLLTATFVGLTFIWTVVPSVKIQLEERNPPSIMRFHVINNSFFDVKIRGLGLADATKKNAADHLTGVTDMDNSPSKKKLPATLEGRIGMSSRYLVSETTIASCERLPCWIWVTISGKGKVYKKIPKRIQKRTAEIHAKGKMPGHGQPSDEQ